VLSKDTGAAGLAAITLAVTAYGKSGGSPSGGLGEEAAIMKRIIVVGLGVLIMLAGAVFTLQGSGVLGGSAMSGVTFWAVAGPVIAVAGLAMTAAGLRAAR
jgi:hypothetical protein